MTRYWVVRCRCGCHQWTILNSDGTPATAYWPTWREAYDVAYQTAHRGVA